MFYVRRTLPGLGGLLLGEPDKKLDQSTSSELKSSQLLASGAGLTAQTLLRSCNSFQSDPSWDQSECADCRHPGADKYNLVRKLTWGRKLDSNGKIHPIICTNANVVIGSIPDWMSRLTKWMGSNYSNRNCAFSRLVSYETWTITDNCPSNYGISAGLPVIGVRINKTC